MYEVGVSVCKFKMMLFLVMGEMKPLQSQGHQDD